MLVFGAFFHCCKFVCFMCDKNLGVFLILCSMFVNILFWCFWLSCNKNIFVLHLINYLLTNQWTCERCGLCCWYCSFYYSFWTRSSLPCVLLSLFFSFYMEFFFGQGKDALGSSNFKLWIWKIFNNHESYDYFFNMLYFLSYLEL